MFGGPGVAQRLHRVHRAHPGQPRGAVALRGQGSVLLRVGGTGFQGANHWLVGIVLEARWLGVDVMQMDDTLPLNGWGMAIVGRHRDGAAFLGTVTRGRKGPGSGTSAVFKF